MQKFILRRTMVYHEKAEVECENWNAAKAMLKNDGVFEQMGDDVIDDETIEYIGEA